MAEHRKLEQWALLALNHFLELYALQTSSFWVRPISERDVVAFQFLGKYRDGTSRPFEHGTLGNARSIYSLVTPDQDQAIRTHLDQLTPLDELQRLAWTVSDLLDRRDLWTAAVTVEVLFEAKVGHLLRARYLARGLGDTEVESLFLNERKNPKSITRLAHDLLRQLGLQAGSPAVKPLFDEWRVSAVDLRNRLVHGTQTRATVEQALGAWHAVKAFLSFLEHPAADPTPLVLDTFPDDPRRGLRP